MSIIQGVLGLVEQTGRRNARKSGEGAVGGEQGNDATATPCWMVLRLFLYGLRHRNVPLLFCMRSSFETLAADNRGPVCFRPIAMATGDPPSPSGSAPPNSRHKWLLILSASDPTSVRRFRGEREFLQTTSCESLRHRDDNRVSDAPRQKWPTRPSIPRSIPSSPVLCALPGGCFSSYADKCLGQSTFPYPTCASRLSP